MPGSQDSFVMPELGVTYEEFPLLLSQMGFIAPQLYVPRSSPQQAGQVALIPKEQVLIKRRRLKRSPRSAYARGNWEMRSYNFQTQERGWEEPVGTDEMRMWETLVDIVDVATLRALDIVARDFEIEIQDRIYGAGSPYATGSHPAAAVWSDPNTALPTRDILWALEQVEDSWGVTPNFVQLERQSYREAIEAVDTRDRIKFWGGDDPKRISRQSLAAIWGVEEVVVAGLDGTGVSIKADSAEGAATPAYSRIWPQDRCLVGWRARSQDPGESCIGRTITWSEFTGVGTEERLAISFESYPEMNTKSQVYRASSWYDIVDLTTDAGFVLTGI